MMTRSPARMLKRLSLCSSLAIATSLVIGPSPAVAQSFEAPIPTGSDITNGGVVTTSPGVTDIALNGGQTVINWTPSDAGPGPGGIGFQYGGTATFHSASDFAVLNRVVPVDPTRIISMDGTIQSLVNGQTGGSVYFYSPAGVVLGPNALINVGSLVLTTSPIAVDGSGQFINGTSVTFGNANPSSYVSTNPGSTINALNQGSYVAMVAPRVDHNGTINVNGAAALVGAEGATINFRAGGLFDIQIDAGTTDANGVVIGSSGVITGNASTGFPDLRRAYLVAVPKNTALTMLISSGADLGFEIAGAADTFGNAIILSAGHDVSFGSTLEETSAAGGALANINVTNSNFTSALYGRASGEALVGANAGGISTFASTVSLNAGNRVRFFSDNPGSTVTVGGDLFLNADADGLNEGDSATAGTVQLMTSGGGSLSVAGNTSLSAVGTGANSSTAGIASGDGTGGTILVQSTTGGDMTLGDSVFDTFDADASGHGGHTQVLGADAGGGFGGTVNVFASGGSSLDVAGPATLTADGVGGFYFNDCGECGPFAPTGGIGGIGDGGVINVQAHTGPSNTMDFASRLSMSANGLGSDGFTGDGGDGLGGDIILSATGGSSVTVAEYVSISAYGSGGSAFGATGDGGSGLGGDAMALADTGGSLDVIGSFYEALDGSGGSSELGNGGYGQGGFGQLFGNGGDVAVGNYTSIQANGRGGDGLASGGEGQGGSAYFSSSNGGSLAIGSYSSLTADGVGGDAYDGDGSGGNGGLGDGGHVEAYANNATLDAQGTLNLSADGQGGSAGGGRNAGDGQGGDVYLQALNGGSLSVAGGLYASAVGIGDYIDNTTFSGDGTGGFIGIFARDGDSTLTVAGGADLNADGSANAFGECSQCATGGIGGIGQGGTIVMASQGVTGLNGNLLDIGSIFATANGYGGAGVGGTAGNGFGGTVSLAANGGNSVAVANSATLQAIGYGGDDFGGFAGGNGTGGTVQITTSAGAANLLTLGGNVFLDASGIGGSGEVSGGDGGNGNGGLAWINSASGSVNIAGDFHADSLGIGGDANLGNAGDGLGFAAEIVSVGADVTIAGSVFLDGSGYGGDGLVAGDGVGGDGASVGGAYILAVNGDVAIGTAAWLTSNGYGGDGTDGVGGTGGAGTGGGAVIQVASSDLGPASVTVPFAQLDGSGIGGSGGSGASGNTGGDGGNGGAGIGDGSIVIGNAGNGSVSIDTLIAISQGTGGNGGDGGNGDGGPGGSGGSGGDSVGGQVTVGITNGNGQAAAQTNGVGNFGDITVDVSAFGGNGGSGNFGSVQGNGGNGGDAVGGTAVLAARGSTVNISSADLIANATGGGGGGGANAGAGGDAMTDEVVVIVTERAGNVAQRGQLNAGQITGTLTALGGGGSTQGLSQAEGGSAFIVRNSDASIGSVAINIVADAPIADVATDRIVVINGAVTITGGFDDGEAFYPGDFTFTTPGNLSLFANNGSMTVGGTLALTAGNFVPDAANEPPTNAGTYFADLITIASDLNIYTTANLDSQNGLLLNAAGFIVTGNLNGHSSDVRAEANGLIDVGDVIGGFVELQAGDSVNAGDITSDTDIQVQSGTDMVLGNLVGGINVDPNSSKAIRLMSGGSIVAGNATALGGIDFDANGTIAALDLTSGEVVNVSADGAVNVGALSGGLINPQPQTGDPFSVTLGSGVSVNAGNIEGAKGVGFATLGSLTTGDVNAGTDVLAMASGNMSFGAITAGPAGRTYLADSSMFIAAGGPNNFDPSLVFGAPPIPSTGSITILGPVSTGSFQAAGASINAGNINAGSFIQMISSGGNMTLGNLVAGVNPNTGDAIALEAGGSILVGNVTALGGIDFDATGSVTGLNITTGGELGGGADGAVSLGNISAGLVNPQGPPADGFSVELSSGTSISVGSVAGAAGVAFATPGALTTGNVTAGTDVLALASGNMSFGSITANGRTYLADYSMFALSQTGEEFDPAPIFAATPVASAGSITIGGPVSTGSFQAAGASISVGDINAASFIEMFASGSVTFGSLVAGTFVTIDPTDIVGGDVTALAGDVDMTGNSIDIGNVSASDNVFLTALTGDLLTGTIDAGIDVTLNAAGDLTTSDITAGGLIDATGASLTLGNLSANSISLTTTVADLTVGNVIIPGNLALTTAGDLIFGDLNAFDVDLAATGSITGGGVDSGTDISALAGSGIDVGDLNAGGDVTFDAGDDLIFDDLNAFVVNLTAGGAINGGNIDSDTNITASAGTGITFLDLEAGGFDDSEGFWDGSVHLTAGGDVDTGGINAQGFVELFAGGNVSTGAISAFDYVDVAADGSILFTTATSGEDIDFDAGTTINGGNVTAGDSITALANGNITLGALSAGIVNPSTAIDAGYSVGLATNGSISTGAINAAADIGLGAAGTIATGNLNADGIVLALGSGNMSFGGIAAGALGQLYIADFSMITLGGTLDNFDPLPILAADPVASAGSIAIGGPVSTGWMRAAGAGITTGDINAATFIDLLSTGGMALGNLTAGQNIELTSGGAVTLLNATAGEIIDFDGIGGNLTGGNMTAGDSVEGNAQGSIQLGALSAGLVNPSTAVDAEHSVKLAALNGSINVGTVNASADIAMASSATMTTGNLNASGLVALLADGNMNLGSITTAGNGRVLLADFSMLALGGDVGTDAFDILLVLAADPVATSGSIAIGGPVSTGLFQATAGQGLSAGAIAAQTIDASAGGTATVNGNWSANDITLASNDIDITASGFLNAGLAGPLTLISTNATQALIGDGLTGTGYALSNAEFGRLHGGAVSVLANGGASAAQDMLIGDLSITGPLAGSTIDNPNGIVVFATGDLDTLTPGGVIRVVGDVEATGFQSGNALEFQTGVFELDAATGSISVEGLNNALGGILDITADRIHVASGAILDQLALNPQYAGYQDDLNDPAAVQRPDGVIRAAQIFVQPTEAVLVQNTGTADIPAGFIANSAELTAPEGAPAGSIELIVNGQLVTETGTLTGIAARDAYVADTDLSIYSDNSMINGCLLVGPCGVVPPPPIDPVGGIAAEITLISKDVLSEQPFGNEPVIDDEEGTEDDESSSAIEPPAPLFDTRPLNPDADIDEPISGSGNPALMGAGPVNDGDQQ